MGDATRSSAAGARAGAGPSVRSGRLLAVLVPAVLVAPLVAAAVWRAAPAWADSIGTEQARAALLATEVAGAATAVHAADLRFEAASATARAATAALEADRVALARARAQVEADEQRLRTAAVDAFMEDGTVDPFAVLLDGHVSALLDRQAFLDVATSGLEEALGSLRHAQQRLGAAEAALAEESAAANRVLGEAQEARATLVARLVAEQAALEQVRGRLAVLVADEQVAQALATAAQADPVAGLPTPAGVAALAAQPEGLGSGGHGPAPPTPENFYRLRVCESGDNYAENTGNGYYGAYQFSLSTWEGLGYSGLPSEAPPAVQDQAARRLQAEDGWRPWPTCSAMLGFD